uniref:Ribosome maturation factor RimP N-terminal domain-containing protein n=1 Tax=Kalanchoe fedtschenkoi TaxID=63787 RepID=A0A7N1A4R6_KALFE
MDVISWRVANFSVAPPARLSSPIRLHPSTTRPHPLPNSSSRFTLNSRKKRSPAEPILKPAIIDEVYEDDEDDDLFIDDEFEDEFMDDGDIDEFIEDDYEGESTELFVGDGGGGGGIRLAGTPWDKEALAIAEDVLLSFDGDLQIYAFRTMVHSVIQVRIEKMSNKSGSPGMDDIEAFSVAYREKLDEAELSGSIPKNISLEVSSPGLERVVRIPQDLDRFKERNMYVKYITVSNEDAANSPAECDGVLRLISFDLETQSCTWGIADVKINREKAGKGRPLNKKQKDWRLTTPFESLRLVRVYADI